MAIVVGVRFKPAGKLYQFAPGELTLAAGDHVIVETPRGVEFGTVVLAPREVADTALPQPVPRIHRKATVEDVERVGVNHEHEKEAFDICVQKIAARNLPMKLIRVEYTFDISKIIFYFTADGRVDFRELVKDLAAVFRTRIELRQVGVRDEAKMLGGIGCCGRELCCCTFLEEFIPVSIRMAKEQNLSLNPAKISGVCGRLMCCLKYENDYYASCEHVAPKRIEPPKPGSRMTSAQGDGRVITVNQQRRSATLLMDDRRTLVLPWDKFTVVQPEPAVGADGDLSKIAVMAAMAAIKEDEEAHRPPAGKSRRNNRSRKDARDYDPDGKGGKPRGERYRNKRREDGGSGDANGSDKPSPNANPARRPRRRRRPNDSADPKRDAN